jgi:hypothetical protein
MTINDDSTTLSVAHCGVIATFTTEQTDIDTIFVLFKAALIAMTYQQETIDEQILSMAEEINNNTKPLNNPFK